MTTNRRSKKSRHRGSHRHGYGDKKRHRGAGHRGGRGNAGSGKEGDCKSPTFVRIKDYFGKHGFISKSRACVCAVNVGYFDTHLDSLVLTKEIEKKGDVYHINCEKLGYNKLLSKGPVTHKLEITVDVAVEKAIAKVEAAGGKVITENVGNDSSEDAKPVVKEVKKEVKKDVSPKKETVKEAPKKEAKDAPKKK